MAGKRGPKAPMPARSTRTRSPPGAQRETRIENASLASPPKLIGIKLRGWMSPLVCLYERQNRHKVTAINVVTLSGGCQTSGSWGRGGIDTAYSIRTGSHLSVANNNTIKNGVPPLPGTDFVTESEIELHSYVSLGRCSSFVNFAAEHEPLLLAILPVVLAGRFPL